MGAACAEQAQMWRIDRATGMPDTRKPLWVYDQPSVDFWHSATFSWDAKVVVFIDESFGDGCPTTTTKLNLETPDPTDTKTYETGNTFFLDARTGAKLSEYRVSADRATPGDETTYCSSHLGNVVPSRDRYLLVNAFYRAGTGIVLHRPAQATGDRVPRPGERGHLVGLLVRDQAQPG